MGNFDKALAEMEAALDAANRWRAALIERDIRELERQIAEAQRLLKGNNDHEDDGA